MFCPPGYVVLHRVESLFRRKAEEMFPLPLVADVSSIENLTSYERKLSEEKERRSEMRNQAIVRFLRSCPSLSVCSREGVIVRIAPQIISRSPINSSKPLTGFWFINPRTWTIDVQRALAWMERTEPDVSRLSAVYSALKKEHATKKASSVAEKLTALKATRDNLEPYLEILRYFEGFALTVAEEDAPKAASDIVQFFEEDPHDTEEDSDGLSRLGRPRKQSTALAAYWKLYPEGHGSVTWKQVTKEISAAVGFPVGADTIRRALGLKK